MQFGTFFGTFSALLETHLETSKSAVFEKKWKIVLFFQSYINSLHKNHEYLFWVAPLVGKFFFFIYF